MIDLETPKQHKPKPPTKKKVVIDYAHSGTVIKSHIKQALHTKLLDIKRVLEAVSGSDFSTTILVRRALSQYISNLEKLDDDALKAEAGWLRVHFR